jgi:hypothetical protein
MVAFGAWNLAFFGIVIVEGANLTTSKQHTG